MTVVTLGIKVDVSNLSEATAALNELAAAFDKAQAALAPFGMTLQTARLPDGAREARSAGAMSNAEVAHLSAQMADHVANIERKS